MKLDYSLFYFVLFNLAGCLLRKAYFLNICLASLVSVVINTRLVVLATVQNNITEIIQVSGPA